MTMKRDTRAVLLATVAAVGALTLTGCINPVDAVVDQVLQGQGVDVDQRDGTVTIQGEDGETMVITGATVPDEFPSELPLPDAKLQVAVASDILVSLSYEGVGVEQISVMTEKIEALGYERTYDVVTDQTIMRYFENQEWTVSIVWDGSGVGALAYGVTVKS